ncbi:MAG: transglutaminase [Desulfuromonas sp.]|nr:MAG: transglutaminase [Desulfuromonas sp.]
MKKILFALLLIFSTTANASTNSGSYTMTFDLSSHKAEEDVKLWVPYPVSDSNQTITNISWHGDYEEAAVYTDKANGTPILFARWNKKAADRHLTLTFDAERNEQIRRDFPKQEGTLNPAEFSHFLAATSLGPVDGGIKELADKITEGETTVLAKAKAIYDWTVENTFRDPETRGCGVGDVNKLLKRPGGKCADISSVYVALARAAGVPSREIFGIRSGRGDEQNVTTWQHCWAEFYLPGYGWVPVDPADVRKAMLKQSIELDNPRTIEIWEYFWGRVDPYRVRLGEGRDIVLNPAHIGPPLNYLMYPFAQVGSETLDWLDPKTFSYQITWRPM